MSLTGSPVEAAARDAIRSMRVPPPHDTSTDETETALPVSGSSGLTLLVSARGGVFGMPVPEKAMITVGRAPTCDVVVPDPSVSRVHARIFAGSPPSLEDAGSHNGTVLLGRRLGSGERVPLRLGTTIELGQATLLFRPRPPEGAEPATGAGIVVVDPAMQRLHGMIGVLAPSGLSILLLGETGTGKEVFARALHDRSPRARGPFVALNCAALPENLLEGELFGYERGAFTGAANAKAGLIEAAEGGTVLLDEVGELPLTTQAKLLRVLETGEVTRLGSLKPKSVDVRFVAATNRDLQALVAESRFRGDLFFRLNGASLVLPPLRQRRSEIMPLAEMFAARAAKRANRAVPLISAAARAALDRHDWPGNVRELRNVVERGVAFCAAGLVLEAEHLMLPSDGATGADMAEAATVVIQRPPEPSRSSSERVDVEAEKRRVLDALTRTFGNQKEAAKLLGISRQALINRLARLGIGRPRKRA